jgi:hypothetical protein
MKSQTNQEYEKYIETQKSKIVRSCNMTRVPQPCLVEVKGVKVVSLDDVLHILLELEYMVRTFPNHES